MSQENKIISRFPPSPTGTLHMGSARTALFNFLLAKKHGGEMRLRMEDTDKKRSEKKFEKEIIEALDWLGISWSGEIIRQSERVDIYKKYLKKLIDSDHAYKAEENEQKSGRVIRFKNPKKTIVFNDLIRGEISVDISELGDFVLAKSEDEPLYHLAVVVDDELSGVTHVVRGEDGLANTPRQIAIQEALGFKRPVYVHIPFILGPDKSKLSKRHGASSVLDYRDLGYLPEAIVNFLALLGWRSKKDDEKELWTMEELLLEFDFDGIQKSPAIFNEEKLRWINREHLKKTRDNEFWEGILAITSSELAHYLAKPRIKKALLNDIRERIYVYSDINEMEKQGEFDWLTAEDFKLREPEKTIWKKSDKEKTVKHLSALLEILNELSEEDFEPAKIEEKIMPYAEKEGKGDVLWPMRYALSGKDKSPAPFVLAGALGKDESLNRIKSALELLRAL